MYHFRVQNNRHFKAFLEAGPIGVKRSNFSFYIAMVMEIFLSNANGLNNHHMHAKFKIIFLIFLINPHRFVLRLVPFCQPQYRKIANF